MPNPSNDELDYLLSRGTLSGPRREQILRATLAASGAVPGRWRRWSLALGGGAGLVVAAGVAAFMLLPRARTPGDADFRAKGGGGGAPAIEMSCLGASVKACPRRSLVAFSVVGQADGDGRGTAPSFVSAYADPVAPGGERIWYLTNEPVVAPVIPRAARIGDEHRPGRYRVEAVVTRRALRRDELAGARPPDVTARARFDLEVVP